MSLSVKNFGGGGSIGSVENLMVANLPTQTVNGITLTNNGNGTYTVNGTATADCYFYHRDVKFNGIAKLVGCPQGGATNKYYLTANVDGSWGSLDIGNGASINGNVSNVCLTVRNGTVCNNLVFKPMLTTNLKATYKEFVKRVGGFNNLISVSTSTQTVNGVTFTNNGDGTVTVNGTASSTAIFDIPLNIPTVSGKYYKYTGCPKGIDLTVASNFVRLGTEQSGNKNEQGNGVIFEGNGSNITLCRIFVNGGQTVSNAVFKPMLTESLLPEYFDFVKGVADGITPQMFGCTKMWSNTIVNASNRTLRNVGNFNHGLGVVPKVYAILIDDDSASSASYMSICQLVGFYADATYHAHIHTCRYPNAFTGERTYSSTDSSVSATSISFSGTTTGYAGGQYLLAGHTYKFIVMA